MSDRVPVRPALPSDSLIANRILLVAANPDDVFRFQGLLRQAGGVYDLEIATDGDSAIRWLTEKVAEAARGRPALPRAIFVDGGIPDLPASNILRSIRAQEALDRTLLVVLTEANDVRTIAEAMRLGADRCAPKFPAVRELAELLTRRDSHPLRADSDARATRV